MSFATEVESKDRVLGQVGLGTSAELIGHLATRIARQRSEVPTSSHVILALYQQDSECRSLLSGAGLSESSVLAADHRFFVESGNARDNHRETASAVSGSRLPTGIHLLSAMLRDPRSAAGQLLSRCSIDLAALRARVDAQLGTPTGLTDESSLPSVPALGRVTVGLTKRGVDDTGTRTAPDLQKTTSSRHPIPSTFLTKRTSRADATAGGIATNQTATSDSHNYRLEVQSPPRSRSREPNLKRSAKTVLRLMDDDRATPKSDAPTDPPGCRNLSTLASGGSLHPVLGREREIESILDQLGRLRGVASLLVGESGVGKTSVLEGLAAKLLEIGDKRTVVEVELSRVLSGAHARGAISDRWAQIRQQLRHRYEGEIIVALDDLHIALGSDQSDEMGSEIAKTIETPGFRVIATTVPSALRQTRGLTPALLRRFVLLTINEPSDELTMAIAESHLEALVTHHQVELGYELVRDAIQLTRRYQPNACLPSKALDALDGAASRARRSGESTSQGSDAKSAKVTRTHLAEVISLSSNIPVGQILGHNAQSLVNLEERLKQKVVGQDEVVARVKQSLVRGLSGLEGRGPLASFLFLGPTGVGKTELAKTMASELFGPGCFTRLDMSEYAEPHALARLIGAPPGYIGHEAGGQLTNAVRHKPHQLVLLDEIEKAHRDVIMSLLAVLDEGRMTDSRGLLVDFRHTVIVMTSNLGTEAMTETRLGFGAEASTGDDVLRTVRRRLPPELWNRIGDPLVFHALSKHTIERVANTHLEDIAQRLNDSRGITLTWTDEVVSHLCAHGGFDASLGARPMRRAIGRLIEGPLADWLVAGGPQGPLDIADDVKTVQISVRDGSINFGNH